MDCNKCCAGPCNMRTLRKQEREEMEGVGMLRRHQNERDCSVEVEQRPECERKIVRS